MKRKITFKEKLQYWFDNLMAKGSIALVGFLFLITAVVAIILGIILMLTDGGTTTVGGNVWSSIMHIIDAGTITGADTGNVAYVILMSIATICGLFVTSILIGIITTGFEGKLNSLKKGNSRVLEQNHTVILGFDHNIYTLLSELILANENHKRASIVILSPEDKETVETAIQEKIPDTKTTKIICRTGSISDINMLSKCSLESARSIIINEEKDYLTINAILAINSILEANCTEDNMPHVVATIQNSASYDAAKIISLGNIELILAEDALARIIAQTCRQPGISSVLIELFDYDGAELYFETFPELAQKEFGEVLNLFEEAIVFGFRREGEIFINPDMNTKLEADDALILLVEDDGMAKVTPYTPTDISMFMSSTVSEETEKNIIIIGTNELLENTILVLDTFLKKGSTIVISNDEPLGEYKELAEHLKNIKLSHIQADTSTRETLEYLLEEECDHVLLLSDKHFDQEKADAITLLQLIHLRDIARKQNKSFSITSELQAVENQKLAQITKVNDLVVGSNIINLVMTQISENRDLATVFNILLQAEGSEIYIRDAASYVNLGVKMNFYEVTEVLRQRNEIAVGYKIQNGDTFDIITNPNKAEEIIFTEKDAIICLAED